MGDETQQKLSLRGLQNAAGFLQSKVAKRIDTRYTPRLSFCWIKASSSRSRSAACSANCCPPRPAGRRTAATRTRQMTRTRQLTRTRTDDADEPDDEDKLDE